MTLDLDVSLGFAGFDLAVSHRFEPGGITAIFGRSGSGKSTLLRIIAGLEPGAMGRVSMGGTVWQAPGVHLATDTRGVGLVFQDARMFPHLNVAGNLAYAAKRAKGLPGPSVEAISRDFDLTPLLRRKPHGLSGGERQRVALARALLSAPRVLLLDEPLAALDDTRKAEILPYLERLRDHSDLPILYVSHSMAEVARIATNIVVMQAGRILRSGKVEVVLSDPSALPDLGVRDAGAVIHARVAKHHDDGLTELTVSQGTLLLPRFDVAIGAMVRVRIPAQDVMVSLSRPVGISALNILPVVIGEVFEGDGPGVAVGLQSGTDRLLARVTRRSAQALGLTTGLACFAVVKSVAVAQGDVGQPRLGESDVA
jgi:molybdate transport system ATP-binding protein